MVNVVPSEVEQSAAPAANACTGVAFRSFNRTKERAIGVPTPMRATSPERYRFDHNAVNDVDKPPGYVSAMLSACEIKDQAYLQIR